MILIYYINADMHKAPPLKFIEYNVALLKHQKYFIDGYVK